jgi:hypothetical protein
LLYYSDGGKGYEKGGEKMKGILAVLVGGIAITATIIGLFNLAFAIEILVGAIIVAVFVGVLFAVARGRG